MATASIKLGLSAIEKVCVRVHAQTVWVYISVLACVLVKPL